jgi:quercetin dioxygenase-like cupin family protein
VIITESGGLAIMRGPQQWFTGEVWIETVADEPEPSHLRASRVYFSPGARTASHSHPTGQTLHVVEGVARVQAGQGSVCELGPGATVRIEAGERHWHGARPDRPMIHLALQDAAGDGRQADWGPHVTDEEYGA